jgi:hypothetical protein
MTRVTLLADAADITAQRIVAASGARAGTWLRWVTTEALGAAQWSWLLGGAPGVRARAMGGPRLPGVGRLELGADDVVLFRARFPEPPGFAAASASDRDYAWSELSAVIFAWLDAVPARILNRPVAAGFPAAEIGCLQWLDLARRAGLAPRRATAATSAKAAGAAGGFERRAIAGESWTTTLLGDAASFLPGGVPQVALEPLSAPMISLLVCDGMVLGAGPASLHDACLQLARLAGADLLKIEFATAADSTLRFAAASARPELDHGEAAFVAARLHALSARSSLAS